MRYKDTASNAIML